MTKREAIIFKSEAEMPPMVVSLGVVSFNKTGTWRYLRPIYEEKTPPCNDACPAGNNVQGFIDLLGKGQPLDAWKLIKETNPFPGVCGRVCPHPCEQSCNRREFDEAISIHSLERLVADYAFNEETRELHLPRREQIAIIGSGPAGLSCAYFLGRGGYRVTVFEALPAVGGMLRVGIPEYRLPRDILDKEIADIEALGISFRTNTRIGDIEELKDYDAVFIATGAHRSQKLNIPGEDVVISGIEFLRNVNLGDAPQIGETVVTIGGGNTAIDAARSALRLGAKSTLVYRRTREEMPAIEDEIEAACEEGIDIVYLAAPTKVTTQVDRVTEVEFIKMRLGKLDETGRKRPIPIEGSEFTIRADAVIAAIGEEADLPFLPKGQLSEAGLNLNGLQVFGGGDALTGAGRVVDAIASGRRAADSINHYLRGREVMWLSLVKPEKLVSFEDLNTAYFSRQVADKMPKLSVAERVSNFSEINLGISVEVGVKEAKRCFSCGACRQCDNCLIFCPEVAVSSKNGSYEIDYEYCKGCGICIEECPCNFISSVEEER